MKLNAIVLHSIRYRDNDTIAYLYTLQAGRQTCILYGRKPSAALLQPLFVLEMEANAPKNPMGIGIIKQMWAALPMAHIAGSIVKTAIALFISEILYRFIKEEEANAALYYFLTKNISALNSMEQGTANFHLHFLTHLAMHFGYFPCNDYDARERSIFDLHTGSFQHSVPTHDDYLAASDACLLWRLMRCGTNDLHTITLPHNRRCILINSLLRYYSIHFGMQNPIRSLSILNEIFA